MSHCHVFVYCCAMQEASRDHFLQQVPFLLIAHTQPVLTDRHCVLLRDRTDLSLPDSHDVPHKAQHRPYPDSTHRLWRQPRAGWGRPGARREGRAAADVGLAHRREPQLCQLPHHAGTPPLLAWRPWEM